MTMNEAQSRELIAAAKALTPQIKAVRDELETARRLPESLVRGLAQVGIFKIYYPRSLGGLEADPLTVFHVVEEISKTDGAVGWVCKYRCCYNPDSSIHAGGGD